MKFAVDFLVKIALDWIHIIDLGNPENKNPCPFKKF
jgi:hypothetical protein